MPLRGDLRAVVVVAVTCGHPFVGKLSMRWNGCGVLHVKVPSLCVYACASICLLYMFGVVVSVYLAWSPAAAEHCSHSLSGDLCLSLFLEPPSLSCEV